MNVSFAIAFTAGLFSFLSPCVLPLIPAYLSYITGVSFDDFQRHESRRRVRRLAATHSLFFILGFSAIFILLGASATYLGQAAARYQGAIRKVGGVLIILFGAHIAGFLKLKFLEKEKKVHLRRKPLGYLGSLLVGVIFAAGWTPCVGPILAAILLYASTAEKLTLGSALLAAYSLGLGLPFFISSVAINSFLVHFNRIKRFLRPISIVSGVFLIIVGVLLFTNRFAILSAYLTRWLPKAR